MNILIKEDRKYENYGDISDSIMAGNGSSTGLEATEITNPRIEGELKELKEINQELYNFSLKHILRQDV